LTDHPKNTKKLITTLNILNYDTMNIGIIGGTKGLGKSIAIFFKKKGFNVTITGRDESVGNKVSKEIGVKYSSNNKETVSLNDIVVISVPINSVETIIKEISSYLKPGTLVIDVASVKEEPTNAMLKYLKDDVEFIPTHPVFGPRTSSLNGQVIVLTPVRKGKWYPKVIKFLTDCKVRIIETNPKEHDDMMAIVQVLTHFSYISTASAIEKLGVNIKKTREFASPIYNLMVDMIARIVSQNPVLTYSIQKRNKNGEKVRKIFTESVMELSDVISSSNKDEFNKIAISATKNMDDIQSALGRSDKAIDSLNHELSLFKKSVNKKVGVKHIYSKEVHVGILKEVNPDFIILENRKSKFPLKLKISNIEMLSNNELKKWKARNYPTKNYDVSCVFPKSCDVGIIQKTLESLDNIIKIQLVDVYTGSQIDEDKVSITFKVKTFDFESFKNLENLLKGFGAILR
jgi:prephenate dehydrogenase